MLPTRLCFQILNVGWLRGKGAVAIPPTRVFRMGDLEYFTGPHILFTLSAIVGLATIVILPPLIQKTKIFVYGRKSVTTSIIGKQVSPR